MATCRVCSKGALPTMRSQKIEEIKKNLSLNDTQRSLVVGMLLGDGHLETSNGGRTYRLKVEHSMIQKEYTDWLYDQLKDLVRQPPKEKIRKDHNSYWFNTYSLGLFRFYAQQFYVGKQKRIPPLIHKLLDPLALAVWFMDDGSFKSRYHSTYIIHTLGYTKHDLELVKKTMKGVYGIEVGLHKQYDKYRLYVYSASAQTFKELMQPYIVPSLAYKLGNTMPKR